MELNAAAATADAPALTLVDPPPAPAPDWGAIRERVLCPLCDYDLRGLVDPRCPECGYAFTWPELFDPALKAHPYLFEHHPRRNVRSFVRTLLGGLRPRRFWQSLRPTQPSRPRRLLLYWRLASVLALAGYVAHAAADFVDRGYRNEVERREQLARLIQTLNQPGIPAGYVRSVAAMGGPKNVIDSSAPPTLTRKFVASWWKIYRVGSVGRVLPPVLLYLAWPWVTFATLMVFNQSMRRAGVRRVHVLRCVLYCCDAGVWLVPLVVVVFALLGGRHPVDDPFRMLLTGLVLYALATTWRLAAAYRYYLRFDHPLATALAAQTIVALFVLAILLHLPGI